MKCKGIKEGKRAISVAAALLSRVSWSPKHEHDGAEQSTTDKDIQHSKREIAERSCTIYADRRSKKGSLKNGSLKNGSSKKELLLRQTKNTPTSIINTCCSS
jgi:hypothetical protein